MTKIEFAEVMRYLEMASGRSMGDTEAEQRQRLNVYFDLLGDLPLDVLQLAAKRVCLEHKWASFPTVAELREAAAQTQRGKVADLTPGEAWDLAWKAAARIDLEVDGSLGRACAKLPPLVVRAMQAFGIPALVYGKEPVGVVRAQFVKIYEQLLVREQRRALLPPKMVKAIEDKEPGKQIGRMAKRIGRMDEGGP